ncbi:MAG: response regulator [Deltaproteobacteria bacterium]|nr:response regulator [Deltaproteobacteria bacterium]
METNRVLIVDDNENILNALNHLLKIYFKKRNAANYHILTATSAEDALAILNETPAVMIVITDIMMPKMDGIDFLRQITHELRRGIQVIMVTGQTTISKAVDSFRNGAVEYITKPFDTSTIYEIMDRTITRLERWEEVIREAMPL